MKHLERKSEEILKTNYEKSLAGEMNLISILTESRLQLKDNRLDLSENLVSTINEDVSSTISLRYYEVSENKQICVKIIKVNAKNGKRCATSICLPQEIKN